MGRKVSVNCYILLRNYVGCFVECIAMRFLVTLEMHFFQIRYGG